MIHNLFFSLFFFTRKGPQKRVKENMLQTTRTNKQNKVLKRLRPVSWRRNKVRAPQNWASHPICNLLAPLPTWAKERLNFAAKNFISFTDEMQSQKGRAPSWQQRMTSWLSPSMVTSRTPALAQNIQASWIARHSAEKKRRDTTPLAKQFHHLTWAISLITQQTAAAAPLTAASQLIFELLIGGGYQQASHWTADE